MQNDENTEFVFDIVLLKRSQRLTGCVEGVSIHTSIECMSILYKFVCVNVSCHLNNSCFHPIECAILYMTMKYNGSTRERKTKQKRNHFLVKPMSVILHHVRSFLWPIREITFIWFPVCVRTFICWIRMLFSFHSFCFVLFFIVVEDATSKSARKTEIVCAHVKRICQRKRGSTKDREDTVSCA